MPMIDEIEHYVGQFDNWVNFTDPITKQTHKVGLTIHFSASKEKWTVGYGNPKKAYSEKHWGQGDTIMEALKDKLDKDNT